MFIFRNRVLICKCHNSVLKVLKRTIIFRYEKPPPVTGCTLAVKHFDDFYKMLFKRSWPSVRLGLFSPQKQVAVVNNFGDVESVKKYLESLGSYNLKSFFEVQKNIAANQTQSTKKQQKTPKSLEKLIEQKSEEEREKEIGMIYSKDKRDGMTAWFGDENGDKNIKKNDESNYIYDPEEATTPLSLDISKAQIDKSRLIIPDSKLHDAGLYEFVPATKLKGEKEFIPESDYYKFYQSTEDLEIQIEEELNFNFPEHLLAYSFDRGEITEFPFPKRSCDNIYDFALMDGADLLAVLCLGIEDEDAVLNICFKRDSIPYCIVQTLKTKIIVCNESKNLKKFATNYLSLGSRFAMTTIDLDDPSNHNLYDKILVDAECTDDRASISDTEDNYFASKNFKERYKLPEKQSSELAKLLKIVKPGGTVLYTTTTMSPIQNDGVVYAALESVWREHKMEFIIKDLSPALNHTSLFFNIKHNLELKYGTLVVPFLPTNFGPRYISKIVKKS